MTELSATVRFENPSSFAARDEFGQTVTGGSDPLSGLTLPIGGSWSGAGDTDDFVVEDTGHTAQRTATSDAAVGSGRFAIAGSTDHTAIAVQVDFRADTYVTLGTDDLALGLFARYGGTSDTLRAYLLLSDDALPPGPRLTITSGIGGVNATLAVDAPVDNAWYSLRLQVTPGGHFHLWYWPQGGRPGSPVISGQHADLATGGSLADGKVGIYDAWTGSGARTRQYDNFLAFAPTPDAAIFAGQSLELRHDRATREDPTGSFSSRIVADGRYLKIPPSGPEGRSTRLVVMALPNDPYTMGDVPSAAANLSVQLFVTPRGLVIPE